MAFADGQDFSVNKTTNRILPSSIKGRLILQDSSAGPVETVLGSYRLWQATHSRTDIVGTPSLIITPCGQHSLASDCITKAHLCIALAVVQVGYGG